MALSPTHHNNLHASDSPNDQEAAVVRKALTGSLEKIGALDGEISHLQNRLATLSLERRKLSAFIKGHRSLLSPARRLLPEILQEIFHHCLPTAHNAVMSVDEAPLVLGRVCSQWRQVAYSTPKLWASIHIVATVPDRLGMARRHFISAWLSRSGTLPLSISMFVYESGPPLLLKAPIAKSYLDLLALYAHRWQSIHFNCVSVDPMKFFNRFRATDVPLLESLYIDGTHYSPESFEVSPLSKENSILQAPLLHDLSMSPYYPHILELRVRWEDITGLDLQESWTLDFGVVTKVLALCPNLRNCAVSGLTPGDEGPLVPPKSEMTGLVLPKLQALRVMNNSFYSDNTFRLFENLITPALRHLTYVSTVRRATFVSLAQEPDRLSSSLQSFLQNLIQPLEELSFCDESGKKGIMDILPLVPGLKRLSLTGHGLIHPGMGGVPSDSWLNDDLLMHLTPGSDGQETYGPSLYHSEDSSATVCLCPKLEVLHCVDAKFSDHSLLDFLRSRTVEHQRYDVSHLRRISVSCFQEEVGDGETTALGVRRDIETLEKETGVRVDFRLLQDQDHHFRNSTATGHSPFDGLDQIGYPALMSGRNELPYFGF